LKKMKIRILQLNGWQGHFLSAIAKHIKTKKYDIVHLQEVAGGPMIGNIQDNYIFLKKRLKQYHSSIAYRFRGNKKDQSYMANATFYRRKFFLTEEKVVWLKKSPKFDYREQKWRNTPLNVLSLLLRLGTKKFYSVNTHLIWGSTPKEWPYKRTQNKKFVKYIKTLKHPTLLTGDFNITADSATIKDLNKLASNLTLRNKISNTLNPRTHKAKHLFPKGWAVDYIFSSRHFKVEKFRVIKSPNLSDHYGLEATLELT